MIIEQLTDPDIITALQIPHDDQRNFRQPTVPVIIGEEERLVPVRVLNTTVIEKRRFIVAYTGSPRFKIAPANNPNNSK